MTVKLFKTNSNVVYNITNPGNVPIAKSEGGFIFGEYSDDIETGEEFTLKTDQETELLVMNTQLYSYVDEFDGGNMLIIPFFISERRLEVYGYSYRCIKAHKSWAILNNVGMELL